MLGDGGALEREEEGGASARAYGDDERRIYSLKIEVADGRAPYELTGNWFIPNFFSPGLEARRPPVQVGDDQRKLGGSDEAAREPADADRRAPSGEGLARDHLEWQLRNGVIDQATYDAIVPNNPKLRART